MQYSDFLASKLQRRQQQANPVMHGQLHGDLFQFQRLIVERALRLGRYAIFADCGLGKTLMQLVWADAVAKHTGQPVLILAPLAVAAQSQAEASRFGIETHLSRDGVVKGVTIGNYEMLHRFDTSQLGGIVLDESSILKSYDGKTRTRIIDASQMVEYRLACTATPAPNDHSELGNHAEFLGVMRRSEMLSTFFVHDGAETQKWRLRGHAENAFWRWVCSWASLVRRPSDLGYSDDGFELPPLNMHTHYLRAKAGGGALFAAEVSSLAERRAARKGAIGDGVARIAELTGNGEQWLVWCDLNDESRAATKAIDGAVEITGSDSSERKADAMLRFASGEIRVLVTKPSIAGFGMNWQQCHNIAFLGLSDSYESYYQAVRRCWRFGQRHAVGVHIVVSETSSPVVRNITRKEQEAVHMADSMVEISKAAHTDEQMTRRSKAGSRVEHGKGWSLYEGDCVSTLSKLGAESVDYSVFSPPFASLYVYSDLDEDMGNSLTYAEFSRHFGYLTEQLFRTLRSGRLVSIHCMNLPTSKQHDGHIGIRDFRGDIIRQMQSSGFIYHSEVCIWKDPVTAMQRTKAIGLLHKQLKKDSALSRQGIPDYLVTFRKPGDNTKPITHTNETFPVEFWQRYASPVWMDVRPTRTLQYTTARDDKDERHICPLQLDVIERALDLWSAPGDVVLSPFAGIGSEGWCSLRYGRKFIGCELKSSYFDVAVKNLQDASGASRKQLSMFGGQDGK